MGLLMHLVMCTLTPSGGVWSLRVGYHSFGKQLCQPHPYGWAATHPHLNRGQRR